MKDAYDLLNEAHTLWQQNAMSKNNAGSLSKNNESIELWCETPAGLYKLSSVKFDPAFGIVLVNGE